MIKYTAIILAGGGRDEVCRDNEQAVNKAYISVGGSPLITRVLRALREAKHIGRVIVVTPDDAPQQPLMLADERRASGASIADSLRSGLHGLPDDEPVCIVASDLPLLTPSGTDEFLIQAHLAQSDICYGYVERMSHETRYPTLAHTWARLKNGIYCGAGVSTLYPRALPGVLAVLERIAAHRKTPWRLASLFGPKILLTYLWGTLSITEIEARATILLGHSASGILTPDPELAVNIDRYDDLLRVEAILQPPLSRPPGGIPL